MTQFGAHACIWECELSPAAAERVIEQATRAGLDFGEIPLLRPSSFDAHATARVLEQHGVGAACWFGLPSDAALADRPKAAERFPVEALEAASKIGTPVLSGVIYGAATRPQAVGAGTVSARTPP